MNTRKIIFKVKHADGVHFSHSNFETSNAYGYLGKSRIDGFPMYSLEYPSDEVFCFSQIRRHFIFNGKPHYTPVPEDFELISSLAEQFSNPGLLEIRPLGQPTSMLYYLDYKYGDDAFDERLLLMM